MIIMESVLGPKVKSPLFGPRFTFQTLNSIIQNHYIFTSVVWHVTLVTSLISIHLVPHSFPTISMCCAAWHYPIGHSETAPPSPFCINTMQSLHPFRFSISCVSQFIYLCIIVSFVTAVPHFLLHHTYSLFVYTS